MTVCSIIFAQWNRSEYTLRTLNSIAGNTTLPIEVILIDSASEPQHFDALNEFRGPPNMSLYVHRLDQNISIGYNKNFGLSMARSPFVLVTDNDMEYSPLWLEKAKLLYDTSNADLLGLWRHPHHSHVQQICDGVDEMNNIPGNCWFAKKELFDRVGPLKEIPAERYESELGEDSTFIFKMRDMGLKAYSTRENLMHHFGKIRSDGRLSVDHNFIS